MKIIEKNLLDNVIDELNIRLNFTTEDITTTVRYEVKSLGKIVLIGSIDLTVEEYNGWGFDNTYIEDIVLTRLGLERKIIV